MQSQARWRGCLPRITQTQELVKLYYRKPNSIQYLSAIVGNDFRPFRQFAIIMIVFVYVTINNLISIRSGHALKTLLMGAINRIIPGGMRIVLAEELAKDQHIVVTRKVVLPRPGFTRSVLMRLIMSCCAFVFLFFGGSDKFIILTKSIEGIMFGNIFGEGVFHRVTVYLLVGIWTFYSLCILGIGVINAVSLHNRSSITTLRLLIIFKLHDLATRKPDIVKTFPSDVNSLVWIGCRAALLGKGSVIPEGSRGNLVFAQTVTEKNELQDLIRPIA